jgi:hypothetical protein
MMSGGYNNGAARHVGAALFVAAAETRLEKVEKGYCERVQDGKHHATSSVAVVALNQRSVRSLSVTASRVAEKALPALTCDSYLGAFAAAAIAIFISTGFLAGD